MVVHHCHADWERIVESETDLADAISHQDDINEGIGDARRNDIIGGCHRDTTTLLLPALQKWNSDPFHGWGRNATHSDKSISFDHPYFRAKPFAMTQMIDTLRNL